MTWVQIDLEVRRFVATTLTVPQLEAWRLSIDGYSERRMAHALGVSRRAVRDRLEHADLRLRKAGLEQDAKGRFRLPQEAGSDGKRE